MSSRVKVFAFCYLSALWASILSSSPLTAPCYAEDGTSTDTPEKGYYRSCGANALAIICNLRELHVPFERIVETLNSSPTGDCSLADLKQAALQVGLDPMVMRVDLDHLAAAPMPAIVHLQSKARYSSGRHYVALLGLFRDGVITIDPPYGPLMHPYEEFEQEWSGFAICFPKHEAERRAYAGMLRQADDRSWPFYLIWPGLACIALLLVWCVRPRVKAAHPRPETLAMLLIPAALSAYAGCRVEERGPRLAVPSKTVNLGVLESGSREFEITVENRGDQSLTIDDVLSSCSCTVPDRPGSIPPDSSTRIHGHVMVRPGPGSATLTLNSNDPAGPHQVTVAWFGSGVPSLIPQNLTISAYAGEQFEREVEVTYPGGDSKTPIDIIEVRGLPEEYSLELTTNEPNAMEGSPILSQVRVVGKAVLRLRGITPPEAGELRAEVVVVVEQRGKRYELPLGLRVSAHDGIIATPPKLFLSSIGFDRLKQQDKKIILRLQGSPDGLSVVQVPPYLSAELPNNPASPDTVLMKVSFAAPPPAGLTRDELVVQDGAGGRVIIPILIEFTP